MSLLRLYHTIAHLQPRQIGGQLGIRLRRRFENPGKFLKRPAPEFPGLRWSRPMEFLPPGPQNNKDPGLLQGRFDFLNVPRNIGWPPDWDRRNLDKLWLYNVHYFEWLWALGFPRAKEAALDWIAGHELDKNRLGWESYPLSLRLMNWIGVFFGKFRKETLEDPAFLQALWRSLFLQAQWLLSHLETHLLGNHYLENAGALAFAGSCFSGKEAENWRRTGGRILAGEISEQILPDGMHFERSPMYHLRAVYLLALLTDTGDKDLGDLLEEPLARMLVALGKICHPDGEIALLNDAAFGVYNNPSELLDYANSVLKNPADRLRAAPQGPFSLPESGYYGFRGADGTYVICDAAPIGPDYIPGHAHADIFTFELSLRGQRVIVDSGVYDYAPGKMRSYCRSTSAHNTVEIEGADQCELWGAFRVGRRGRPRDVRWEPAGDGFRLSARHDGYRRLPGSPNHYRRFHWKGTKGLEVLDRIEGSRPLRAISRIHLHPACKIEKKVGEEAVFRYPKGRFRVRFSGSGSLTVKRSFYCPEFGKKLPNNVLEYSFSGQKPETGFRIEAL